MTDVTQLPPHDERMLVVIVTIDSGHPPEVKSCEVLGHGYRNRVTFTSNTSHETIFSPHFYVGLDASLAKLSGETELMSFPDYALEIPGLTLHGLRLISTKESDGKISVICRFRRFLGSMQAIFRNDLGINNFINEENARLSSKLLSDLAMPLLNICAALESDVFSNRSVPREIIEPISKKANEIAFQIELIKRYVSNAESFERMADDKDHFSHSMSYSRRAPQVADDPGAWAIEG